MVPGGEKQRTAPSTWSSSNPAGGWAWIDRCRSSLPTPAMAVEHVRLAGLPRLRSSAPTGRRARAIAAGSGSRARLWPPDVEHASRRCVAGGVAGPREVAPVQVRAARDERACKGPELVADRACPCTSTASAPPCARRARGGSSTASGSGARPSGSVVRRGRVDEARWRRPAGPRTRARASRWPPRPRAAATPLPEETSTTRPRASARPTPSRPPGARRRRAGSVGRAGRAQSSRQRPERGARNSASPHVWCSSRAASRRPASLCRVDLLERHDREVRAPLGLQARGRPRERPEPAPLALVAVERGVASPHALAEARDHVLHEVGACEAVLAHEHRRAGGRLAADAARGEPQREIPVLVPEHDVLGVAQSRVEHGAVEERARVAVVGEQQPVGVPRRRDRVVVAIAEELLVRVDEADGLAGDRELGDQLRDRGRAAAGCRRRRGGCSARARARCRRFAPCSGRRSPACGRPLPVRLARARRARRCVCASVEQSSTTIVSIDG